MKNLIKYGFIAVVILSFMSCANDNNTRTQSYDWEWAEDVCKDKKGVRYYNSLYGGCRCNDGQFIDRNN